MYENRPYVNCGVKNQINDDHRSYTQPTQLRKESLQTFLASNPCSPGGGDKGKGMIKCLIVNKKGVFLSVNPKTDFRSKNGFRVPFGKTKSGFLIW